MRHPFYGDHGFLHKTVEVSFPLSREILLLMSWSDAPRKEILERDAVDMANRSRAAHSDRYLYAHVRHNHILALDDEFKDSGPNMSTEGFGPLIFALLRSRAGLGNREGPPNKCFSVALFMPE